MFVCVYVTIFFPEVVCAMQFLQHVVSACFLNAGKNECLLCVNRNDVAAEKNINCSRLTSLVCLERYGCGSGYWVM